MEIRKPEDVIKEMKMSSLKTAEDMRSITKSIDADVKKGAESTYKNHVNELASFGEVLSGNLVLYFNMMNKLSPDALKNDKRAKVLLSAAVHYAAKAKAKRVAVLAEVK